MRTLAGILLQQIAVGTFQCLLCCAQDHGDMSCTSATISVASAVFHMTTHLLLLPQMKKLRCFMYVSTAYSNAHLKRYSTVHEQLYPLREQDGREVDHAAVVDRLLAMPVEEAQQEVNQLSADIICCIVDLSIWLSDSNSTWLSACLSSSLPASQPAHCSVGMSVC